MDEGVIINVRLRFDVIVGVLMKKGMFSSKNSNV